MIHSYIMTSESLLKPTERSIEEDNAMEWAIEEERIWNLVWPWIPNPMLQKLYKGKERTLQPRRKSCRQLERDQLHPTEEEVLSTIRKRPATPPTGSRVEESSTAATASQQVPSIEKTVIAADGTPTTISVTSVIAPTQGPIGSESASQQTDTPSQPQHAPSVETATLQPKVQNQPTERASALLTEPHAEVAPHSQGARQDSQGGSNVGETLLRKKG